VSSSAIMTKTRIWSVWLAAALVATACGESETESTETESTETESEQTETESTEGHDHGATEGAAELPEVPEGASVSFIAPADGATVRGPLEDGAVSVHVEMGVEGMQVQPAGEVEAGTGHHHIIIDGDGVAMGEAVPNDETHLHFGGGQTETDVALTPGEHTLRLQFADGLHRSYGPSMSTAISITVEEGEPDAADEGDAPADETP